MERKKQLIRLTNYSFEVLHELIANTPVKTWTNPVRWTSGPSKTIWLI